MSTSNPENTPSPAETAGEGHVATAMAPDEAEVELEPAGPPPVPKSDTIGVTGHLPAALWPPKTVADLMTRKVITLRQDEPIGDLEAWMDKFQFHHLPVVDPTGKLVGLISHTDLLHAALGVSPGGKPIEKAGPGTLASAIMRRNVVTGQPDAPITTACRVMLHEKLGCLPIILQDTTLVGIVTGTDFTRLSLELLERPR